MESQELELRSWMSDVSTTVIRLLVGDGRKFLTRKSLSEKRSLGTEEGSQVIW